VVKPFAQRLPDHFRVLRKLSATERIRYVVERITRRQNYGNEALAELPGPFRRIDQINRDIQRKYVPQAYHGQVVLLRARESVLCADGGAWDRLVEGKLEVIDVPGNHGSLLDEPHVAVLARKMRALFERAGAWAASAAIVVEVVNL
jgi:thioesterase domain-containing protein